MPPVKASIYAVDILAFTGGACSGDYGRCLLTCVVDVGAVMGRMFAVFGDSLAPVAPLVLGDVFICDCDVDPERTCCKQIKIYFFHLFFVVGKICMFKNYCFTYVYM